MKSYRGLSRMRAGLPIVLSIAMAMSGVPALALEEVNAGNDDEDIAAVAEVVDDETLDDQAPLDELDAIAEDIEVSAGAEESEDVVPIEDAEAVETDEEKSSLAVQSDDEAPSSQSELSGTIGTCAWNIDSNGCLTINPTNGSVGELPSHVDHSTNVSGPYGGSSTGDYSDWPWNQDGGGSIISKVKSVKIQGRVMCGADASYLFCDLFNATSMDLSGLDTSRVKKMRYMFWGCNSLETIDFSSLDTTNVQKEDAELFFWFYQATCALKKVVTGAKFTLSVPPFKTLETFTFPASTGKWWSYNEQRWLNEDQMEARSGIVDTYTSTPVYDLSKATVTVAKGFSYIYNGTARTPEPTVTFGSTKLQAGTHYTVSYKNNVNAGTATVTVTGKGDYEGSKSATFKIVPVDIDRAKVTSIKNQAYTGKALKPSPKVTFGGKTLKKGTDYTLSYAKNKKVGKATVTIKGKGNFSGTKKVTFKVVPKGTKVKRLKAGARAFTVKWAKQAKQTTGYQIQYSRSATFAKGNKTVTVKKTTITSRKVKGLLAKKKYYVRVRTYRKVGGVTYYSAWSAKKAVTTK